MSIENMNIKGLRKDVGQTTFLEQGSYRALAHSCTYRADKNRSYA